MALYHFHRFLIAAAILFAFGFSLYLLRQVVQDGGVTGEPGEAAVKIVMLVLSPAAALGMVAYLIYFNNRLTFLRQLTHGNAVCRRCEYDLRRSITDGKTACPECGETIPSAPVRS